MTAIEPLFEQAAHLIVASEDPVSRTRLADLLQGLGYHVSSIDLDDSRIPTLESPTVVVITYPSSPGSDLDSYLARLRRSFRAIRIVLLLPPGLKAVPASVEAQVPFLIDEGQFVGTLSRVVLQQVWEANRQQTGSKSSPIRVPQPTLDRSAIVGSSLDFSNFMVDPTNSEAHDACVEIASGGRSTRRFHFIHGPDIQGLYHLSEATHRQRLKLRPDHRVRTIHTRVLAESGPKMLEDLLGSDPPDLLLINDFHLYVMHSALHNSMPLVLRWAMDRNIEMVIFSELELELIPNAPTTRKMLEAAIRIGMDAPSPESFEEFFSTLLEAREVNIPASVRHRITDRVRSPTSLYLLVEVLSNTLGGIASEDEVEAQMESLGLLAPGSSITPPPPSRPNRSGHRVLIVDDSPVQRILMQRLIQEAGYEVETAEDGARGLEMLENQVFDLAIVDFQMPVLTGVEMIQRARDASIEVPMLMATVTNSPPVAAAAIEVGAEDLILKPISPRILLGLVDYHLARRTPGVQQIPSWQKLRGSVLHLEPDASDDLYRLVDWARAEGPTCVITTRNPTQFHQHIPVRPGMPPVQLRWLSNLYHPLSLPPFDLEQLGSDLAQIVASKDLAMVIFDGLGYLQVYHPAEEVTEFSEKLESLIRADSPSLVILDPRVATGGGPQI